MAVGDSAPRSRSRRQWVRIPPKGRLFSKEGTSAGPWMCVCLSGADVRVVEGRATSAGFESQAGWASLPWMLCVVVFVLCRPERGEEKRWAWVVGEPRRTTGKNEKNKPTVKVPDRKGERLKKNILGAKGR
jgi:hypothetical protein